jgi:hypothetical protein
MSSDRVAEHADSRRALAPARTPPVSYSYSATEKLKLFIPSLRQRLLPKKNLFAGPFTGEFGYELMQWQGYVRARRPHYETVHVLTYPGREFLYEGCTVHHHAVDLKVAGYGYGVLDPRDGKKMAVELATEIGLKDYDVFDTTLLCTRYHRLFWGQEFRLLREGNETQRYDLLFHFRAVRKEGYDHQKNYRPELADELAGRCLARGISVGCIGHPDHSYCAAGCADLREIQLRKTVAAITAAKAVAGENSGPMHLANLCGSPTIIWAQDQWRVDYSLRWNPFRVPIYVAANETCQPDPERVTAEIVKALADLEIRTSGYTEPAYTLPAQPIAYY